MNTTTTYLRTRLARIDARELHTLTREVLGYGLMLLLALAMVSSSFFLSGRGVHAHGVECAPVSSAVNPAAPSGAH